MPAIRPLAALIGGLAFTAFSPAAFAGGSSAYCGAPAFNGPSACNPGAVYSASPYQSSPMQVAYTQPFDHFKNVGFKQTPNMNVLRVQSGAPVASLSDSPSAYWGGCTNASGAPSAYCGAPAGRPIAAPRPIYAPRPVSAPVFAPRRAAPVQYGNANTAPQGHAYVSYNTIVHRLPPVVASQSEASSLRSRQTSSYASPSYSGSSYGSGGWKQVSGPTMVDGMMATQVICKQPDAAPAMQPVSDAYQVVRPIVEVRYPVAVQVPSVPYCGAPAVSRKGHNSRYGR